MSDRKKEWFAVGLMIFAAVVVILCMRFLPGGSRVVITCDGEVYGEYSLNENQEILIQTQWGENRIVIENQTVKMKSASCPDKLCVHMSPISEETPGVIVCLPNKVIVECKE